MPSTAPGGPETPTPAETADPQAGPGALPVQVRACAIDRPDVPVIEDRYRSGPQRPFAPGDEIAGIVAGVGEGVTGRAMGDRVIAKPSHGGLAERAVVASAGAGDEDVRAGGRRSASWW